MEREFTLEDMRFLLSLGIGFDELETFSDDGTLWLKLFKEGKEVYSNYEGEGNIPCGLFKGLRKGKRYTHEELEGLIADGYPFAWLAAMAQRIAKGD